MYDVITIGAATRDVFLMSRAFKVLANRDFPGGYAECVTLGAKIEVDDMVLTTGGGATNAAATFGALGFAPAVITKVGNDEPAHEILADLQRFKVDTGLVIPVKKGRTAYSTLLTTTSGERTVLVYRGVSDDFKESDVRLNKLKTHWFYMTSLAGNTALALKIAKHAKSKSVKVAWNPGSLELQAGSLQSIIKLIDVLQLNVEEAQKLTGQSSRDPKILCRALACPGVVALLTDGANGSYAYLDGHLWFARTSGARSVSRTGAGDAFGSGFVAAIMKGMTVEDALRVGTLNAESVVQQFGAKAGILRAWPKATALATIRVRKM